MLLLSHRLHDDNAGNAVVVVTTADPPAPQTEEGPREVGASDGYRPIASRRAMERPTVLQVFPQLLRIIIALAWSGTIDHLLFIGTGNVL